MADSLPLPAQLSAAFVALAIEIDNAAERHIAHRTTSFGGSGRCGGVWLASITMWFNAIRALVDADELTVAELRQRTGLDTNVDGLRRWGYATVNGIGRRLEGQKRPIPKPNSVLRLTSRGRAADAAWAPLPAAIEQRWRDRLSGTVIDRLRAALLAVMQPDERAMPDYLPILTFGLWADRQRGTPLGAPARSATDAADDAGLSLISLLARVLLAFTLDYEADARLALPVWADGLRLLASEPTPVRDLPARAGVGTEAMTIVLKHLERVGCAEITPIPGGRGKQARLTERGERAQSVGSRRIAGVGHDWAGRSGSAVDELRSALEPLSVTAPGPGRRCSPAWNRGRRTGGPTSGRPNACPGTRWCCTAVATRTGADRRHGCPGAVDMQIAHVPFDDPVARSQGHLELGAGKAFDRVVVAGPATKTARPVSSKPGRWAPVLVGPIAARVCENTGLVACCSAECPCARPGSRAAPADSYPASHPRGLPPVRRHASTQRVRTNPAWHCVGTTGQQRADGRGDGGSVGTGPGGGVLLRRVRRRPCVARGVRRAGHVGGDRLAAVHRPIPSVQQREPDLPGLARADHRLPTVPAVEGERAAGPDLVAAWYQFGEVRQNWLGFTEDGNSGHGLGACVGKPKWPAVAGEWGMSESLSGEQSVLIEVEPAVAGAARCKAPVDKTFRWYVQDQPLLLPPDLRDWLPVDHPARMVDDLVEHGLDLAGVYAGYTEVRGLRRMTRG